MPARFKILPERRLVVSQGMGVFTPQDYLGQMLSIVEDPTFRPTFNHLVDCREITTLAISHEQMRTLGRNTVFSPTSKRAFVVSTDVLYGMTRVLAAYREAMDRQEVRVFREMAEALAWLDLPPDFEGFPPAAPDEASNKAPDQT